MRAQLVPPFADSCTRVASCVLRRDRDVREHVPRECLRPQWTPRRHLLRHFVSDGRRQQDVLRTGHPGLCDQESQVVHGIDVLNAHGPRDHRGDEGAQHAEVDRLGLSTLAHVARHAHLRLERVVPRPRAHDARRAGIQHPHAAVVRDDAGAVAYHVHPGPFRQLRTGKREPARHRTVIVILRAQFGEEVVGHVRKSRAQVVHDGRHTACVLEARLGDEAAKASRGPRRRHMQLAPPAASRRPRVRRQRKGAIQEGAWKRNGGERPDLEKAHVVQ
eukprot:scaffold44398_cov58-Phaeocystis_antarctica.AAC.1